MEPVGFDIYVMLGFGVFFLVLAGAIIHVVRSGTSDPRQVHRNAAKMLSIFRRQRGGVTRVSMFEELD